MKNIQIKDDSEILLQLKPGASVYRGILSAIRFVRKHRIKEVTLIANGFEMLIESSTCHIRLFNEYINWARHMAIESDWMKE